MSKKLMVIVLSGCFIMISLFSHYTISEEKPTLQKGKKMTITGFMWKEKGDIFVNLLYTGMGAVKFKITGDKKLDLLKLIASKSKQGEIEFKKALKECRTLGSFRSGSVVQGNELREI